MRISVDFLLLPVENPVENVENIHFFLYNFCRGKAIFFSFPVFRSCFLTAFIFITKKKGGLL